MMKKSFYDLEKGFYGFLYPLSILITEESFVPEISVISAVSTYFERGDLGGNIVLLKRQAIFK